MDSSNLLHLTIHPCFEMFCPHFVFHSFLLFEIVKPLASTHELEEMTEPTCHIKLSYQVVRVFPPSYLLLQKKNFGIQVLGIVGSM
jgi:hypothetical protein